MNLIWICIRDWNSVSQSGERRGAVVKMALNNLVYFLRGVGEGGILCQLNFFFLRTLLHETVFILAQRYE
jgi:hypothetical protein